MNCSIDFVFSHSSCSWNLGKKTCLCQGLSKQWWLLPHSSYCTIHNLSKK